MYCLLILNKHKLIGVYIYIEVYYFVRGICLLFDLDNDNKLQT